MKKVMFAVLLVIGTYASQAQISYPSVSKGLSFKSDDDKVKMKFSFRIQSLASFEDKTDGSDPEMKAMIRRMRLKSNGYIYDPKFEYKLELALSNRDMGNEADFDKVHYSPKLILDAVLKYHLNEGNQLWFGQTKLPGNRERVISSMALQFVDRSNVNSKFNIDRDFGVQYRSKVDLGNMPVKLAAAVTTGEGRNITVANEKLGMAYTGRIEVYPLGSFTGKGDYFSADLKREEKGKLAIGASYCFNNNTNRSRGQLGDFVTLTDSLGNESNLYNDINTLFVDFIYKNKGFSLQGEFASKSTKDSIDGFAQGLGYVAQAGYLFKNNYEMSGRYTSVNLANGIDASVMTNEYTLGVSKYFVGHKLKVQSDISYIATDVPSALANYRIRFQVELGI